MDEPNLEANTANETPVTAPQGDAHRKAIEETIEKIRPYLQRDGGDCELVDVSEDGKKVSLRLKGACSGCPSATYTLKLGIEQTLREQVPGVEIVESVP